MRILVAMAGLGLLVAAGLVVFFDESGEGTAYRVGAGLGRMAAAVGLVALVSALYLRFVARRPVRLRSPWLLLAAGVLGLVLSLSTVAAEEEERQAEIEDAAVESERCESETGSVFTRLPAPYEARRLPPDEVATYERALPAGTARLYEFRDLHRGDRYVGRVAYARTGPDAQRAADFLDGVRDGAEESGASVREEAIDGTPVVKWRVQGVASVAGRARCGGLIVSTPKAGEASRLWASLAG